MWFISGCFPISEVVVPPNGCELRVLGPQAQVSGRGSFPHIPTAQPADGFALASGAESPVRSSEWLGCTM